MAARERSEFVGLMAGDEMLSAERRQFTLELSGHPPTLNQMMRGKLRQRIQLQKAWNLAVLAAYRRAGCGLVSDKRRVTIAIILGPRQRGADPDAYFKATGDALVSCGALLDDSRVWVEWAPVVYLRGDRASCRILLEDL